MKINYYYRHPKVGFSIGKVYNTIAEEIRKSKSVKEVYMPSQYTKPWDVIRNGRLVKSCSKGIDVNHITGSEHYLLLFLPSKRRIVTVHDLGFYTNHKRSIRTLWKKMLFINTLKLASKIICISEFTKNEIQKIVKLESDNFVVIPNPVSPLFQYKAKVFNKDKPVILHIGTGKNKNLHNTIKAIRNINCSLRIIGKITDETKELLAENNIDYSNAYNLSDLEIVQEYIKCDIVNFPSYYEGFGMPIIEGQATGRVVVTSYISPMKEVAGDGAFFVNPGDIDSMAKTYRKIIEDNASRNKIIHNGLVNVEKYSVKEIADKYLKFYDSLLVS